MLDNITPAYLEICQIICDQETIFSEQDLRDHLKIINFSYTKDDLELAYSWSMQGVKRIIVYNFGESALHS